MFLRKNNLVRIDFLEADKHSKEGIIKGFDSSFIVIQFNEDDFETMIPYHTISSIEAINPKLPSETMLTRTQQ